MQTMRFNYIYSLILIFSFTTKIYAQQIPAPAQSESILVLGATLHIGDGNVIENGALAFDKGKITLVGDATQIRLDRSQYGRIIEANGQHLYPGFIAPNTQIGLTEIDAVRATNDFREVGVFNPNIRSVIAFNTDSKVTPTIRSNGILIAQIVPQGGRISGQSSVMELDGWNWEDAVYRMDDGIHLSWPRRFVRSGWWAEPGKSKLNKKYDQQLQELDAFFASAQAYQKQAKPSTFNLKFDAMKGLFDRSKTLYLHIHEAKAIMTAIQWAKEYDLKVCLVGGRDAWMIADFLKDQKIGVILRPPHSLPSTTDTDIDMPYKSASLLHKAGVHFCFSLDGAWAQRNLGFQAGQAVAYGLPYEAAISALTRDAASLLGISDRVGTLTVGKDATVFISTGDALDMRFSAVQHAFIRGKAIDLDNKQKALYRKYQAKYKGKE